MNITDSLGLDCTFKDVGIHKTPDKKIHTAVTKCNNHPSITATKRKVKMGHTFELGLLHVMTKIEALETSKPSSDSLPTTIIQEVKDVPCPYITVSINATIDNSVFRTN